MGNNHHNNILWTASDMPLPKDLWSRLEDMGYRVLMGDGGNNTLDKIHKVSPKLWVDQINGEPDGHFSALEQVVTKFPELPIVLLSSQPTIDEAVKAIKLGISDYLPGVVTPEKLWVTLEGALNYPRVTKRPQRQVSAKPSKQNEPIAIHPSMQQLLAVAKRIAPSRSNVLIQGESGTGKEVLARYIHQCSDRASGPFIAVNCAALPETLLESELFGHERGAFTGAVAKKKGKFELANGGSLLLDEISEIPLSMQAKLLRVGDTDDNRDHTVTITPKKGRLHERFVLLKLFEDPVNLFSCDVSRIRHRAQRPKGKFRALAASVKETVSVRRHS